MLEVVRRRLRGLLQFLEKAKKVVVYTSFQDELSEATFVELPGITPGTDWQRFRAKAAAYLKQHQDHIALQRVRRNKALTLTTSRLSNRCSSTAAPVTPPRSTKPSRNPTALGCSSARWSASTARQP